MDRKRNENRILTVLLAVLIFGLAAPEGSLAVRPAEDLSEVFSAAGDYALTRSAVKDPAALPAAGSASEKKFSAGAAGQNTVITVRCPAGLPTASDETEQGRSYLTAVSGNRSVHGGSLRHPGWAPTEEKACFLSFSPAPFRHRDLKNSFDNLFVIHFIHSQDGKKG